MYPSRRHLAALCLVLATAPWAVEAQIVDLDFSILPGAQGWSYLALNNSRTEAEVFSVAGSKLTQNSLGVPFTAQGSNSYTYLNAFDRPGSGFSLAVRARLTGEEVDTNHWGFGFFPLDGAGAEYGFGLGSGLVITTAGQVSFDTSVFHDYLLIGRPGATPGTGTFQLFADGGLLIQGAAWSIDCVALGSECNSVVFGDGTGGANGAGELTAFSFAEAVPAPATWAMLAPVLGLGWARRRRPGRAAARFGLLALLGLGSAQAAVITDWDADSGSLPDALSPPWTFGGSSAHQGQGLSAGVLTIATVGDSDSWFFSQEPPLGDLGAGFSIEARMRYVSGSSSDPSRAPAVIAFALGSNSGNALYIGEDRIFLLADNLLVGEVATVDTDGAFHSYRIDYAPPAGFAVSYDGTQTLSGSAFTHSSTFGPSQSVLFGDGSMLASGTSQWEFVRNTEVPAPAVAWLLLCGLPMVASRRRAASRLAQGRDGCSVGGRA
jgi:hypothetical protein